ncbi:MAG: hypothetical protein C5B55_05740 [Blastocatellia bacterium]|nr:MAG: hypothetical protein C5B55_05740 [Blastocatellia bacterium]
MKRVKKVLLVLLLLMLVSQIPFAYRRYKLHKLNSAIQLANSKHNVLETDQGYKEYRGVAHVHSFLGGHSSGQFADIISAAQANQLQFVIMTEHKEKDFDTAEMTLKGDHGGVLFVNGNEVSLPNDDRLLVLPGTPFADLSGQSSQRNLPGQVGIVAYPESFKSWQSTAYDGIEVYNVYSNARQINPIVAFFDVLWSHRSYPDLLFASFYKRPDENLRRWDQLLTTRKVIGLAGNDAHANIGLSLIDSSGKTLVGLQLDPYPTSFHLVRLHVLLPTDQKLDQTNLLAALREGHCFIGFDLFGDTSGFRFTAKNGAENRIQGDEIALTQNTRLEIALPVAGSIRLVKDGSAIGNDGQITFKEFEVKEKGVYRVEVYLPQLGRPVGDQPWIISNPIYVR